MCIIVQIIPKLAAETNKFVLSHSFFDQVGSNQDQQIWVMLTHSLVRFRSVLARVIVTSRLNW